MLGLFFVVFTSIQGQVADGSSYPPPGRYAHDRKITESYDRFRDQTTLKLDLEVVRHDKDNDLEIKLFHDYKGEGRSKPDGRPSLMFTNEGRDGWRYLKYHPITLIVDGERFAFDPKHDGDVEKGYVLEYLWVHPTKDQFLKIAKANSIEVKVGSDSFSLSADRLLAIRDFGAYVGSPSSRVSTPYVKRRLQEAHELESKGQEDQARRVFEELVIEGKGMLEGDDASKALKRLDDPAHVAAKRKLSEAASTAIKKQKIRELQAKIQQTFKIATAFEKTNPSGALSYYKDVLEESRGLIPAPPEVAKAKARIKVLEAAKK